MAGSSENTESAIKWLGKEVGDGENSILVYPDLQSFRQIYSGYVKDHYATEEEEDENTNNNNYNKLSKQQQQPPKSRITLIATFYETIDSVKHHLSAVGIKDVATLINNGSIVIIDVFQAYHPNIQGMKKLLASLSERARKEGRAGVIAIVDMGYFFLFGGDGFATQLIKYESGLSPKTEGGNIKGINCYHAGNYKTLTWNQRKEISAQGQKKILEVKENAY